MAAEAQKNGAVAVAVRLVNTTIDQLGNDPQGVKADVARRKSLLLAELGPRAWNGGQWDNQMGQIGLHVTPAGLNVLQSSANAAAFYPDTAWNARTKLNGLDGSHAEIERLLQSQGFLDADVTLNTDGLQFDTLKDGSVRLVIDAKTIEEGRAIARTLLTGMTDLQLPGKTAALANVAAMTAPTLTLRLTREGLLKLAESEAVRSLKPVGFRDARPLFIAPDAMDAALRDGAAQVIVTIRTPLLGGNPSKASFAAQTQAHKRAIDSLLAGALASAGAPDPGQNATQSALQDLSTLGGVAGRLTYAQLQTLKASGDARLLAIELNRPVASPSLTNSAVLTNMPAAWGNPNFRGAGQNIIVMDTGVQANHQFLTDAAGNSRVFFEGCFGSNITTSDGTAYSSICPQQGTSGSGPGDSPGGLPGSAAPCGGFLGFSSLCLHGTMVAGIAAGRASPSPWVPPVSPSAGFQGMVPDARIAAFHVFSYTSGGQASVFAEDLALLMQLLVNIMTPGTTNNPFVVNMSFGGGNFPSDCSSYQETSNSPLITNAVQMLTNMGVPVVAATGNEGLNGAITWPACVANVIKVGSVINNSTGSLRATHSNLANPSSFPLEQFWLAPGGGQAGPNGVDTRIRSSSPSASSIYDTSADFGTSYATPHVSGFYAALKAIAPTAPVSFISNWIKDNASVPVNTDVLCTGSTTNLCSTQFRRPRWP